MAITVLGNHGRGYMGHGIHGTGSENIPVAMGWDSIAASKAGDVAYIQLSSLINGDINQGVYFQSSVAATVEFTLANPAQAVTPDPSFQAGVKWANSQNVVADTIVQASVPVFTVIKITFSAPGIFNIGVR